MSQQQVIHVRDEKPRPRTEGSTRTRTSRKTTTSTTTTTTLTTLTTRTRTLTRSLSSQKYQNSRTTNKQHKSLIFNACSAISDRHNKRQHVVSPPKVGTSSIYSCYTTTSFNTTRSILEYDVQDESSGICNQNNSKQLKKYFGHQSREDLYERYHWLAKKQQIMNNGEYETCCFYVLYSLTLTSCCV